MPDAEPRVVVLSPRDHFHAPIVLREMCLGLARPPVGVVLTPKLGRRKGTALWQVIRRSGVDFLVSMVSVKLRFEALRRIEISRRVPFEERLFLSMREVIRRFALPCATFGNANSRRSVDHVRSLKPQAIVLNLFNQIAREPLIASASEECLNLHTSPLPLYRGIGPNFWALANGERFSGAAVHRVLPDLDAGDILAEERVGIDRGDSFFSLYRRCAVVGARLLVGTLRDPERAAGALSQAGRASSYFGAATREAVSAFRRRGRSFFSSAGLASKAALLRDPSQP